MTQQTFGGELRRLREQRFTDASGSVGRTFCIPEHAVLDSLPSERVCYCWLPL